MARMRGAVYGEEGTVSGALKGREADIVTLVEPLKPDMDRVVMGLDLRIGIKRLTEAVDMTAVSLMYGSTDSLRERVTKIAEALLKERKGPENIVLKQALEGQSSYLEGALQTRVRDALANYGRQRLRDRYVQTYTKTYDPEIAAGDLRVTSGLPHEASDSLMRSVQKDLSQIADRSFCLESPSRAVFVTIGKQDFELLKVRESSGAMADGI